MAYLYLPGSGLYYQDTDGPGTCDGWVHHVPAFTAAGYPSTACDRRPWGRSKSTAPEHPPGFAAADPHARVEGLSMEPVHLVATAAGAITALDYALAHPQKVRSPVAANTIGVCRTNPTWQCSVGSVLARHRACRWNFANSVPPTGARTPRVPGGGWK